MVKDLLISLRFVIGTLLICAALYPAVLLGFAQVVVPDRANGSLIEGEAGKALGSHLIAQAFTRPEYVWPRPSACGHNGAAASGSNLGPSNSALTDRARADAERLGATLEHRAPAELVAASGSGLDPHITLDGALFQAERVAGARSVDAGRVRTLLERMASRGNPWTSRLVNVLEVNLALDNELGRVPR